MKQLDVHKLLGGYATDTLTAEEREALFAAALEDQQLFEALADEQALRDLLRDTSARQRVLRALEHQAPQSAWARARAWLSPAGWRPMALAGGLATMFLVGVVIRQSGVLRTAEKVATVDQTRAGAESAPPLEAAQPKTESAAPTAPVAPPQREFQASRGNRVERDLPTAQAVRPPSAPPPVREEAFARAPASVPAPSRAKDGDEYAKQRQAAATTSGAAPQATHETIEVRPMPPPVVAGQLRQDFGTMQDRRALRLAVLGVQNYMPQEKSQAEVSQTVQEMLAKKLDAGGQYSMVSQAAVDKAFKEQNLGNKPVDAGTVASIGRSVGADAVIVSNVSPAQPEAGKSGGGGAAGGFRPATPIVKQAARAPDFALTAYAIDTRTASNVAAASTTAPGAQTGGKAEQARALSAPVDRLAAQLGQQLNRRAPTDIDAPVSLGGAGRVTFTAGSRVGVRVGDRFDVSRDGIVIGQVTVTEVQDSSASGVFEGKTPARVGDRVVSPK